jgi:transposase
MDDAVLECIPDCEGQDWPSVAQHLLREVRQLRQETVELRRELAEVRRENLELRQQVGYWKSMHARATERVKELEAEVEALRGENRKLQARLFGQKSEQSARRDRSNRLEGENDDEPPSPPRPRGQQQGSPGPKRRDHSHLPALEVLRELPEDERVCPKCRAVATPSDTEDSEQIEIEVRAYRRVIRRRRYQRTCHCPDSPRTITAPPAPKLIPKGLLGISVWVEVLIGKFFSHMPIARLLAEWELLGLKLSAGTIAGGLQRLEPLFTPVYEALLARNAQSPFGQGDETRWMVFIDQEGKVGHRWWLWAFLGLDTVVFRLDPTRCHDVPERHYTHDASLILMVDRYSAYKAMAQVKKGTVVLAFCWAHVRRDFVEVGKGWSELKPWAIEWLRRIRDLYRAQRLRLEPKAGSQDFQAGDTAIRRIVGEMQSQAAGELANPKLREPCRKALESLQNHWTGLTRFVDDLRIPLDNNASERAQRNPAVGRKNYYGSGALWSGTLAAKLFSIFATLERWSLNPRDWLTQYLQCCAENGGKAPADVTPFLPWNIPAKISTSSTAAPVAATDSS